MYPELALRLQGTIEVGGGGTAVDEKVGAGDEGAPGPPADRLGHDPLLIAALGQLIGVEGVPDALRPEQVQARSTPRLCSNAWICWEMADWER